MKFKPSSRSFRRRLVAAYRLLQIGVQFRARMGSRDAKGRLARQGPPAHLVRSRR